ncbi:hypothetical protein CDAR_445961 [Caerostris darwini]|uniref:Uncharacterized protein n=1 Tax=Caerostris darwini TaxID=1538125 RepID=A0AAV4U0J9_9ARAC|nr:hypothetical protein CDAR_445961 [Caerostris darwini]
MLLTPGNHSLSAIARDTAGKIIARRSDGKQDKNHNQEYRPRNEKRLLLSTRSMPALLLGMFAFPDMGPFFRIWIRESGKRGAVQVTFFVHNRVLSFPRNYFQGKYGADLTLPPPPVDDRKSCDNRLLLRNEGGGGSTATSKDFGVCCNFSRADLTLPTPPVDDRKSCDNRLLLRDEDGGREGSTAISKDLGADLTLPPPLVDDRKSCDNRLLLRNPVVGGGGGQLELQRTLSGVLPLLKCIIVGADLTLPPPLVDDRKSCDNRLLLRNPGGGSIGTSKDFSGGVATSQVHNRGLETYLSFHPNPFAFGSLVGTAEGIIVNVCLAYICVLNRLLQPYFTVNCRVENGLESPLAKLHIP